MQNIGDAFARLRIGKKYEGQALEKCPKCGEECEMYLQVRDEWRIVPIACKCKRDMFNAGQRK